MNDECRVDGSRLTSAPPRWRKHDGDQWSNEIDIYCRTDNTVRRLVNTSARIVPPKDVDVAYVVYNWLLCGFENIVDLIMDGNLVTS